MRKYCEPGKNYANTKITYIFNNNNNVYSFSRRTQTQSQYLNFGGSEDNGKAEAEATFQGSRAIVSK